MPVGLAAQLLPVPGLVLTHLRNGDTYTRRTFGFGAGVATAWRYVQEAVRLLAAAAPTLAPAMQVASSKAYVILDGTLIPIDRPSGSNASPPAPRRFGLTGCRPRDAVTFL